MIIKSVEVGMLHTNCYLIGDEKAMECAIFDPGASTEKIMAMIEEAGMAVKYIVLTHGHFDHVMAAPWIREATGAPIIMHRIEKDWLKEEYVGHRGYTKETYVAPPVERLLEDGDTFFIGSLAVKVMLTPGHTKGSCVFLVEDVMLAGDTLFKGACGRWDLETGSEHEMMLSLRALASLEGDYRVLSGHGSPTTLQAEREANPYMRLAAGK